jgi:hypothetical protein
LAKKTYDKIQELIGKGYTNKEIAEEAGVSAGTVSRQRKLYEKERSESTVEPDLKGPLSAKSIDKLYKIQGMLGVESLDMAVDQIFADYVLIMREKFEYDSGFDKTPGEVFNDLKEAAREHNRIMKGMNDLDVQIEILRGFGLDELVVKYYHLNREDGYRGSLIDYIGENALEQIKYKSRIKIRTVKGPVFLNPDDPHLKKLQRHER